jgi:predicted  nucleic acid-binding Zn-ribbon protein
LCAAGTKQIGYANAACLGQIAELNTALAELAETHQKTCRDLQELLSEQHRMGARWKDESKNAADRYEGLIRDLEDRLARTTSKFEDINEKFVQVSAAKNDLVQQMTESKRVSEI